MGILNADFDVPTAYLTAINTVGVLAHRIDVVAYEISVLIEAGLDVDEDLPGAFMPRRLLSDYAYG